MMRSGIVIQISEIGKCGVIQDSNKREFYFSINQCCQNELPKLHSTVSFLKDPDYKSTDVAILIKPSSIFKKAV